MHACLRAFPLPRPAWIVEPEKFLITTIANVAQRVEMTIGSAALVHEVYVAILTVRHVSQASYTAMPTFDSKTYVRPGQKPPTSVQLNRRISKNPVWLFGVPFIGVVLGGAYVLSNTQNVRFERRDSKVKLVSEEDALGLEHGRRKVNAREEYYRLQSKGLEDLDEWENKRIERLPGQNDNVLAPSVTHLDPAPKA